MAVVVPALVIFFNTEMKGLTNFVDVASRMRTTYTGVLSCLCSMLCSCPLFLMVLLWMHGE